MLNSLLIGFIASVVSWAQPYAHKNNQILSTEQTVCLTEAEYFESRGEGTEGIAAVAYIILNRALTRNKSICEVIHEKGQFSYYNPNHKRNVKEIDAWIISTFIAVYAQLGVIQNPIGNATMFTASKMSTWLTDARYSTRINGHYFYIEKKYDTGKITFPETKSMVPLLRISVPCLLRDRICDPLYDTANITIDSDLISMMYLHNNQDFVQPVAIHHLQRPVNNSDRKRSHRAL